MAQEVLLQPDNHTKKYEALFLEIDQGRIKIPQFQREFVWDKEQSARLIDSIIKGYPVGTFIFWKTKEELRSFREIGNFKLPLTPKGDFIEYVLDGQQRITSLYAVRKGIRITSQGKTVDYRDIYIDLDSGSDAEEQIIVSTKLPDRRYVSVYDVLTKTMGYFYKNYEQAEAELIEIYKSRMTNYDFSCITIKEYPIDIATEVFSRINTGGKRLTVFEIMVARTYDEGKGFDLVEKFEALRDGDESDGGKFCLKTAKFETIPEAVIIQAVGALAQKTVRSSDILKMKREKFISSWPVMKDGLFSAVEFIRHEMRIPVSHLLPYPSLLVALSLFFHLNSHKKATKEQRALLEQWFYWVAYNYRYSSGTEAKLIDDFNKMESIINNERPSYKTDEIFVPKGYTDEWQFSGGDAGCKMILCLLAFNEPKSFDTNGIVNLDNSHLKIATSRNYHHFFPKAFISRHAKGANANLMSNITLVDAYSNNWIRDKPPSKYIAKFEADNDEIDATLKSHLIGDRVRFGISSDDYDQFIAARSHEITRQLNKKLNPFKTA